MKIHCDFETRSECDLKKAGAFEYAAHPSTEVLCLAFKTSYGHVYLFDFEQMQKPFREQKPTFQNAWGDWIEKDIFLFIAHNAFFEQSIYNEILVKRFGWPEIPITKWRCTAAKAAASAIPRNLADAGAVMRLSVQKDFKGHQVMLKLCKPTSAFKKWNESKIGAPPAKFWTPDTAPEDFKALYHYCKLDVLTEEKLDDSLPDLTPFEQEVWFLDQKVNLRGVAVDLPLVNQISEIMASESKAMVKELDTLTMGLVGSGNERANILEFLKLDGIEMPDLRSATVDDFLANGKVNGDAAKILNIRKSLARSSTAKYNTFKIRAASDGRVRDLLLYCGAARTGRWGGKGVQPQNFPRGVIKNIYEAIDRIKTCDIGDLKMLYGDNLMPLFSSVLRGMFVASPGHEMFVQDFSTIESRVLFWLAGHEEGLKIFYDGRDPYKEMARHIFNCKLEDVTDEKRQVGKAAFLGAGFGIGHKKFKTSALDVYRAEVTKEQAKIAVTAYREIHWPVVELWEQYESAAIQAVENPQAKFIVGKVCFVRRGRFLNIILPGGRELRYCDPNVVMAETKVLVLDDEPVYASTQLQLENYLKEGAKQTGAFVSKRLTYFEVNQIAKNVDCVIPKWAKENTYGGKIVENVVQAVARNLLAEAMVRAENAGYKVLFHAHDELVSEAPIGTKTSEEYQKLMEVLPDWATGLPLKSSGWVHTRYRK
jgi:DNA polymerase